MFGTEPSLKDKVSNLVDITKELRSELTDLRKHLGIEYKSIEKDSVLSKVVKKEKPKTWKDKLVDAVEEAVDERY